MAAVTVCMYVLAFAIGLGILIAIIVVVPQIIYTLPYTCWCGWIDADHNYPTTKDYGFFKNIKNATKLYKHWIFHKELDF